MRPRGHELRENASEDYARNLHKQRSERKARRREPLLRPVSQEQTGSGTPQRDLSPEGRKKQKVIRTFLKYVSHIFKGCKKYKVTARNIEFNVKKNKPPEAYVEVKGTCKECGRLKFAYTPRDQQ